MKPQSICLMTCTWTLDQPDPAAAEQTEAGRQHVWP